MDDILDLLDLKGAIITVDALNCQKNLAKKIDQTEGKYLFALKGNHGYLYNQIIQHFKYDQLENSVLQYFEKSEKGHGRIEVRKYTALHNLHNIKEKDSWSGLASIVKVESSRTIKGKTSTEERYYTKSHN
jgi:predicted transposase YbfD/YdcC